MLAKKKKLELILGENFTEKNYNYKISSLVTPKLSSRDLPENSNWCSRLAPREHPAKWDGSFHTSLKEECKEEIRTSL